MATEQEERNISMIVTMLSQGVPDEDITEVMGSLGFKGRELKNLIAAAKDMPFDAAAPVATVRTNTPTLRPAAEISEEVQGYLDQSMAQNTRRAYAGQWKIFEAYCQQHELSALPATPNTVASFFAIRAKGGSRALPMGVTKAAVRFMHRAGGYADPTGDVLVESTLKGIRRSMGTKQNYKRPVFVNDLKKMVATLDRTTLRGKRDASLVLLSFATASRVSEIVGLQVSDLTFSEEGITVNITKSKSDQESAGMQKSVVAGRNADTCPITAVKEWLQASGITEGSLFRSVTKDVLGEGLTSDAVRDLIKRMARKAGINPDNIAGHSLRSGAISTAAKNGVSLLDIQRLSQQRSTQTVIRYIHRATLHESSPSGMIGL
jgi:integrase